MTLSERSVIFGLWEGLDVSFVQKVFLYFFSIHSFSGTFYFVLVLVFIDHTCHQFKILFKSILFQTFKEKCFHTNTLKNIKWEKKHFSRKKEGKKRNRTQKSLLYVQILFRILPPLENLLLIIFNLYIRWYQKSSDDPLVNKLHQESSLNHLNHLNWSLTWDQVKAIK